MNIGIACQFRQPDGEDLDLIRADETIVAPGSRLNGKVKTVIGYLVYSISGKLFWSFVRYQADELWDPSWNRPCVPARIGTTRVGEISCPHCGSVELAPVWGKEGSVPCPHCGKKGCQVVFIKERSERFFEMVGDLRGGLEAAAIRAESDPVAEEFRFPTWYVGGSNVDPSADVPPVAQGKAQALGFGLKPGREISFPDGMFAVQNGHLFLDPAIFAGVMPDSMVEGNRLSWSLSEGSLVQSLSLYVQLPKPVPAPFRNLGSRF